MSLSVLYKFTQQLYSHGSRLINSRQRTDESECDRAHCIPW